MSGDIERLVAAIDENADLLHGDRTPAVEGLVRHGIAALPHVFPLLEEGEERTRLRAQRVLEGVTQAWVQEHTPSRPMTRASDREWQNLWRENGSYDWKAPADARQESVRRWRDWLANAGAPGD